MLLAVHYYNKERGKESERRREEKSGGKEPLGYQEVLAGSKILLKLSKEKKKK